MIQKSRYMALASILLAGCAINQTVSRVERFAGTQVCIVVNPDCFIGWISCNLYAVTNREGIHGPAAATGYCGY